MHTHTKAHIAVKDNKSYSNTHTHTHSKAHIAKKDIQVLLEA